MLTGDHHDLANNSAPNAQPAGGTSGTAASPSPQPTPAMSGSATIAGGQDTTASLHPKHLEWLEARGISGDLARRLGLATAHLDGKNWIAVPYVERGKTVNHKYRMISEKRHRMDEGAPLTFWNHDCLLDKSDKPVVICEGEWDAMVALSMGWRAVSVPNGAPADATDDPANAKRYDFLWRAQDLIAQVSRFILATDADAPGIALRQDLISLLGADRCSFVEYPEALKDLNDVQQLCGKEAVAHCLNNAKPVPVKGLFRLSDFPEPRPVDELPIGVPGLSDHISIVAGTLTVLTGYAGQGKTSLTIAIIANLIRHNVPVAIGTFETQPRPILERKLRAALIGCQEYAIPVNQIHEADKLIADNLSVIAQMVGEDQEMDLDEVLQLARVAVQRDGAKLVILDPWNEIEHKRRANETETDYIGRAIRAIKQFAREHHVAVWIVAHPTKPQTGVKLETPGLYTISGSAHWANKADYGLVYSRPDKTSNIAKISVTKVRMGLPGKEGEVELEYDWRISAFRQSEPTQ